MPVWFNPLFKVPAIKHEDFWRNTLRLNTIKDLFKDDGSDYSKGELLDEIDRLARVEGDYVKIKSAKWVKTKDLLKQWDRILFSIPLILLILLILDALLKRLVHPVHAFWQAIFNGS